MRRKHINILFQDPSVNGKINRSKGKQPRTVHIDVYCTGSEDADESGSSGSELTDKPKTVFDGQEVRVVHRRAGVRELPLRRRRSLPRTPVENRFVPRPLPPSPPVVSFDDNNSVSSLATNNPSFPSSLSTDTVASSWKETDMECLRLSGLSLGTTNSMQNDSFEYADSSDRLRIMRMAERWSDKPSDDRLYVRRLSDIAQQNLYSKKSLDNSTDSLDDDDGSEMGWTFSVGDERPQTDGRSGYSDSTPSTVYRCSHRPVIGPFGVQPVSPRPAKLQETRIKPFAPCGEKTDCSVRAEKFGVIVNSLKKPGHHIGPAKNPDCTCSTCRRYFEECKGRGRTKSVGDLPSKTPAIVKDRQVSIERDSLCSQFSYLKDLV